MCPLSTCMTSPDGMTSNRQNTSARWHESNQRVHVRLGSKICKQKIVVAMEATELGKAQTYFFMN